VRGGSMPGGRRLASPHGLLAGIRRLTDVVIVGTRRIDLDAELGRVPPEILAKHVLGGRRPTDVARADEQDPSRPGFNRRFKSRAGFGTFRRRVVIG